MDALLNGSSNTNTGDAGKSSSETLTAFKKLRLDNDPHVFLNRSRRAAGGNSKALGMSKALLIPDFVDYGTDPYDEEEIASSNLTSVFMQTLKGKPKLELISLSTWIAANAKIMDYLIEVGQLKSRSDISDYLLFTDKIVQLIERYTFDREVTVNIFTVDFLS